MEYVDFFINCRRFYSLLEIMLYSTCILLILGFLNLLVLNFVGLILQKNKAGVKFLLLLQEKQDLLKQNLNEITLLSIPSRIIRVFSRNRVYGFFSFSLSCVIVLGDKINVYEKPYFKAVVFSDFIDILLYFFGIFIVGNILIEVIEHYLLTLQSISIRKRWWFVAFVLLVLLWLPYVLVFYPGILTPDSFTSLLQAKDLSLLYNHIPVAYTLMITFFTRIGWFLGDSNFGVFLFSIAQVLIVAGVLSYLAYWVRIKTGKAVVACVVLLFYGLNPVVAMYSITMWKDVIFSAGIVLLCLFLFDVALEKGKVLGENPKMIQLCILFAIVCFGRNNGIYIVVFCWLLLLLSYKCVRKKILLWGGSTIVVIVLIQGPGYKICGINQANFAESVGIPLQQISYAVINDETFTETEKIFLENLIPIKTIEEDYSPVSVDNIKFNVKFDNSFLEQNKAGFVKMYFKLLPKHLSSFVKAYLLSTSGFWKVNETGLVVAQGIYENDMGIYSVDCLKKLTNIDMKEEISVKIAQFQHSPIIDVGIMVWLVFLYVIVCFKQRQSWKTYLVVPLICSWITIMIATPVFAQFRYVYYYHLMLPVVCIMFFAKRGDKK